MAPLEETQQKQHEQNVLRINLNTLVTSVFGLAILAMCSGVYGELKTHGEKLDILTTKIPYIEADVAELKVDIRTKISRSEYEQRMHDAKTQSP